MSFLLKNDVEVLKESKPMLSTIVKGMLSLQLSNYNYAHNMITVFKHKRNFMSFPLFLGKVWTVFHKCYFFHFKFQFPSPYPGYPSLFFAKFP